MRILPLSFFGLLVEACFFSQLGAAALPQSVREAIFQIDDKARTERIFAIIRTDREYRKTRSEAFKFVDRIEIYLLNPKSPPEGIPGFPVRPYKSQATILKKRDVDPKQIPDWCTVITKAITSDKETGAVFCHLPQYGIRVYAGEEALFESSVCWSCFNYSYDYERGAEWESFSIDGADLKEALEEFLPPIHDPIKR